MNTILRAACFSGFFLAAPVRADEISDALRDGHYSTALQLAETALKDRAGDPRLLTARALALAGTSRVSESLRVFDSVLRSHPHFVPALRGAAQTSYAVKNPRVRSYLDRLLKEDPDDATAHLMSGVLAYEAGDASSAVSHFEAGQITEQANPAACALYAACLSKLGRKEDAVLVFERLNRAEPTSPTILRSLAAAQADSGKPELAVESLRRALTVAAPEEQTYVDLAALYLSANDGIRTMAAAQDGLEHFPKSARLIGLRGVVESENGLEAAAERDFARSNDLDPAQEYGTAGLGVLLADSGRIGEAIDVLRRRVRKTPKDATLNYLLAAAIIRGGAAPGSLQFQEAQAALLRAVHSRPDYAAAHASLGKLYSLSGDRVRAMGELRLAIQLDRSNRSALNHLAELLRREGRIEEAKQVASQLRQVVMKPAEIVH